MTAGRETPVTTVVDSAKRGATVVATGVAVQVTALHRLEASRAQLLQAMADHLRESAAQQDAPRDGRKPLMQRLIERARRLPVVRTALAIRDLRRG